MRDRLFDMEADLQLLAGLLLACRSLGELEDGVEPETLNALARCSPAALERLRTNWRGAVDASTGGTKAQD
jgi:hypothetical protein